MYLRTTNRRVLCAFLTLATVLTGLLWRNAPLHLPFFLWKYGGSCLWAIAVYWFFAFLLSNARPILLTTLSCLFALAVELSRLIQWPPLEAFRLTLAGRLILGSIFSPRNIAAYWLAIFATALIDNSLRPSGPSHGKHHSLTR